ncbi:MAG: hypothetical protein K1000chlam2_01864, partial [Chlamydiae bacterium]|nr:hypothetical protein [Chlamydiota bacterium]
FSPPPNYNLSKVANILKIDITKYLSIEKQTSKVFKALLDTCKNKKWDLLKECGDNALASLTDKAGRNILQYCMETGEEELFIDLMKNKILIHHFDAKGNTSLHIAAQMGNYEQIPLLLNHIDIDTRNNTDQTPLHIAAQAGQFNAIKTLLVNNASDQILCKWSSLRLSPLALIVRYGYIDCIPLFVEHIAKERVASIGNILHLAIHFNQIDVLEYLLNNYSEICKHLIKNKNKEGLTPLALAAYLDRPKALILLHTKGANIEVRNYLQQTPLHLAAKAGNHEIIQTLVYLGCQLSPMDTRGKFPLNLGKDPSCQNLLKNLMQGDTKARKSPPNFAHRPPQNLAFKGGGPKGIAFLGALEKLQKEKMLNEV